MEEVPSLADMEELGMDLDDPEGSDLEDDDGELTDEQAPSPFIAPSPGPCSAATSTASSPVHNEELVSHMVFPGKGAKRGRGRPRREGGKVIRRPSTGGRIKKLKPSLYGRGGIRRWKSVEKGEYDFLALSSAMDDFASLDSETGAFIYGEKEKNASAVVEEIPYSPEQWPGKVCAFCNLGERSQLGQGELLRLNCPEGFVPQRVTYEPIEAPVSNEKEFHDKSPRAPVTCRRQKSFNKCRNPSLTSEYIDELTIIGYAEEPDISILFESNGQFYVHRSCAMWSKGVIRHDNYTLDNVGPVIVGSSSKKCSFCNHYGASLFCKAADCFKIYHYPCATASGAFQDLRTFVVYCQNHLAQASVECEGAVCYTCKTLGDIANLMYCSSCGEHYHGICVGLAQLPGVRSGWQCRKCRLCQVCRMVGDESKLMACEQCEKVYHATCQRPIVATIPKYGWKCRCCRLCGDCGSRTPGAGLSSRWHAHYTVCDSCYQQRNKGFFCPLCHRAYRAHAHREMVLCSVCHKFVHGTCDPDADVTAYQQKKENYPEYEYICPICKNHHLLDRQFVAKRPSTEDQSDTLSASQDSSFDEGFDFDVHFDGSTRATGLGKGKPFANRIVKKRLGLTAGGAYRPKGGNVTGKVGFMKRQKVNELYRKRGAKTKMRGMFGVPGVGLQRPLSDGKTDDEPGGENRLVLCSAKDKYVLTQDICVMCGAIGTDQEGCLISCIQCGQCYHPYCVNVKVTKVILEYGWRCLDCTVCEGCGQRNDESKLILCDECDISYHIYCMDPPLDNVPQGTWKCKRCAVCQTCGATDPGFNCVWMNSFTACGPCTSLNNCPSCNEHYKEGELVIQCMQCERWLHGTCDSIASEDDAEKCAADGYYCVLCRPRDEPPPHLVQPQNECKPPTPTKSPESKTNNSYLVDGVYLSEAGHNLMKSLCNEYMGSRKKRKKIGNLPVHDKEAGIMATIESVIAGVGLDSASDDTSKLDLGEVKEEPQEIYKEGMMWTKEYGPIPEGFTLFTMENGLSVLRKKRQRNLQKLGRYELEQSWESYKKELRFLLRASYDSDSTDSTTYCIGGFVVRMRGIKSGQESGDLEGVPSTSEQPSSSVEGDKPRRKPIRRKIKSKLAETFPSYIQEAFFGRDLLDSVHENECNKSDDDSSKGKLPQADLKMSPVQIKYKQEKSGGVIKENINAAVNPGLQDFQPKKIEKFEENSVDDFKDVLSLPGGLVDNDLVETIMNENDQKLSKRLDVEGLSTDFSDSNLTNDPSLLSDGMDGVKSAKDELCDVLGPNFSLDSISNINGKDVDDIFKGVLTDESQESQDSSLLSDQQMSLFNSPVMRQIQHPSAQPVYNNMAFMAPSPRHSDYGSSPQFSPNFSEPASPWVTMPETPDLDPATTVTSSYNQRSSEKMRADESLGNGATISAVLYANINHPEWKGSYSNWSDRYKQIIKKWRSLPSEEKAPYLQQARDNRSALRMKKQQQFQEKPPSQKTTKETEQEKQWKRLQQLRHIQNMQQQGINEEIDESFLMKSPSYRNQ